MLEGCLEKEGGCLDVSMTRDLRALRFEQRPNNALCRPPARQSQHRIGERGRMDEAGDGG